MAQRDWNPPWWSKDDTSAWDRVKSAFQRDWEQTKHDFSKKHGRELNQDVDDTVKQAAGKQPIPSPETPNPPDEPKRSDTSSKPITVRSIRDDDWARSEEAIRYGYGAAGHYGDRKWDPQLESQLQKEWRAEPGHASWEEMREHIEFGWKGRREKQEAQTKR